LGFECSALDYRIILGTACLAGAATEGRSYVERAPYPRQWSEEMNAISRIVTDLLNQVAGLFLNTLLPWAWDNKFWVATLIPLIVVIAIAKWMWD
jgi:hypothetical protein